jgi:hypothetical protein
LLKQPNFISNWAFGAVSAADKALLAAILKDTDAHFLKWAINAIVHWQNTIALENLYHIHGTADRVLPIRFVNCNYSITGGGHFMTVNKASEVTSALRACLG